MHTPDVRSPGAITLRLLRRAQRRHACVSTAYAVALGFGIALLLLLLLPGQLPARIAAGATIVAAALFSGLIRRRRARIALLIEQRARECRNLIVTAEELLRQPTDNGPVRELVLRQADRIAESIELRNVLPINRALIAAIAAGSLYIAAIASGREWSSDREAPNPGITDARIRGVDVIITPPAYTALKADTLHDPAGIGVPAGSTLHIAVRADADSISAETVDGTLALAREDDVFRGALTAAADGFIALHASAKGGRADRRLIALTVTPDRSPLVRITSPARDLYVATPPKALDIVLEAEDDLGLGSLTLSYTRVSGSGEQFEFVEGEIPLRIERRDARTWTARGTLPLDAMKLAAGDMVVYRGIATDRRPGAPPVESDAYIFEVAGPGALAAGGFAADDKHDRYAISQQMLIVETERLEARRPSLSADQLREQAMRLASLQRQVRAEFVFMMGGEFADDVGDATGIMELNEEEEAEAEDDILAGRLANRGRAELFRAIREMSHASSALTEADLPVALEHERTALVYLQRAFSRTRYILRTLTTRERLDLSRRLTGTLADAARDVRPIAEPEGDARVAALRASLAAIAQLATAKAFQPVDALRAAELASELLRIDPAAPALQQAAARITRAADAIAAKDTAAARPALQDAALQTATVVRAALAVATIDTASLETRALHGALVDALRRRRPR